MYNGSRPPPTPTCILMRNIVLERFQVMSMIRFADDFTLSLSQPMFHVSLSDRQHCSPSQALLPQIEFFEPTLLQYTVASFIIIMLLFCELV